MLDIDALRAQLLASVQPDGGWPYYAGKHSRLEPTAWAMLALGATGDDGGVRAGALGFLGRLGRESGLLVDPGAPRPNAAWNGLLLLALRQISDRAASAVASEIATALVALHGTALRADASLGQDNSLRAWPWIAGTFSWVEPTAYCTLALKTQREGDVPGADARVREADRLLIDRACEPAGWNYGNSEVLGQDLRPYVPTTALALLALQDRPDEPVVRRGLEWLEAHGSSEPSAMALSLAAIGLNVFARSTERLDVELAAAEARTGFLGNLHLAAMALYAVTVGRHGATAFRL